MSAAFTLDVALELRRKGWAPIRARTSDGKKVPADAGVTGWRGTDADERALERWAATAGECQIGVRMPTGVIGIDVDDGYGDKNGARSLAELVARYGPLPASYSSTSRGAGPSRITFYAVPATECFHDAPADSIEVIQRHHRFALVAPSTHPKTGERYRWYDLSGCEIDEPPNVEDLPELPWTWVEGLRTVKTPGSDPVTFERLRAFLEHHVDNRRPERLDAVLELFRARRTKGLQAARVDRIEGKPATGSRHAALLAAACWAFREAAAGAFPARRAFDELHAVWLELMDEPGRRGTQREPSSEFLDACRWAVAQVDAAPERSTIVDTAEVGAIARAGVADETGTIVQLDATALARLIDAGLEHDGIAYEVERILKRDRAREIVAELRGRDDSVEPIGAIASTIERPEAKPARIDGLLHVGGRLDLVAQRKTGKTTLSLGVAYSVLTGEPFLGHFTAAPIDGNVGWLNYELDDAMAIAWYESVGIDSDRLYLANLRGRPNPLSTAQRRTRLVAELRGHEVELLIVDPFAKGFAGDQINDTTQVVQWCARVDEIAYEAGVSEIIVTNHTGWDQTRGRNSTALEDWADTIVNVTKDEHEVRYLKATGRDVDVAETKLDYDKATRRMSFTGISRAAERSERRSDGLIEHVVEAVTEHEGMNVAQLERHLREHGVGFQRGDVGNASKIAEGRGLIRVHPGARGARLHYKPDPSRLLPTSPDGSASTTPDPLLLVVGVGGGTPRNPTETGRGR